MIAPNRPRAKLLLAVFAHAVLALGIVWLSWAGDMRSRFLPDDPATTALLHEEGLFGSAEIVAVLVEADEPILRGSLCERLPAWREELEALPGVQRVTTLLDVPVVEWVDEDRWRLVPLGTLDDPASVALRSRIARKGFLRRDGHGAALFLELEPGHMLRLADRKRLSAHLESWIRSRSEPYRFSTAGMLTLQMDAVALATREAATITGVLVVTVFGILAYALASSAAAAGVVVVSLLNISATFGLFGYFGAHVSQFSFIVAAVIFTVGLLDNVHLTTAYMRVRTQEEPAGAATLARNDVFWPCFWTTATTVAGFCVLLASSVPQIRQFGALAATGTAVAFGSTFLLLQPLLALVDPRAQTRVRVPSKFVTGLASKRVVLFVATASIIASVPGLLHLRVSAEFPRIFADDHPITRRIDRLEREWGGLATISFLLSPRPEADRRIQLERLRDFTGLLASRELVSTVLSPVDVLADARDAYRRRFGHAPANRILEAAWNRVLRADVPRDQRELLAPWVAADADTFRIVARVRMNEPARFASFARDLEGFRSGLADVFAVQLSGWPLVYKRMEHRLLNEMVRSFVIAFAVVALLLLVALRSVRWWLLALIPNVWPLLVTFGALGLSGRTFASGLLLVPAVALGLVVDDTIHFLMRLRRMHAEDPLAAVRATTETVGTPLTITSIVLALGFASMLLSSFRANQTMAVLMASIVALAWLADVVLVPALLLCAPGLFRNHTRTSPP